MTEGAKQCGGNKNKTNGTNGGNAKSDVDDDGPLPQTVFRDLSIPKEQQQWWITTAPAFSGMMMMAGHRVTSLNGACCEQPCPKRDNHHRAYLLKCRSDALPNRSGPI